MAELGFLLTLKNIAELVESPVSVNSIEHAKKIIKFGGRPGHPGPDWMNSFFKRNNLSLKQATELSVPRYNATKNLFIIYHYSDILEQTIDQLNLRNSPHLIWNCDNSELPHEPKKCYMITEKGQKTLLVSF